MSLFEQIDALLKRVSEIEHQNYVLSEMNAKLQGSILAKDVEIAALKKELEEWKRNYQ